MPPKRKAAANHSAVSQRKSTRRDTDNQNESSAHSSRTYTESEVEAMISRAVQEGVEKACRQFSQQTVGPQNELNSINRTMTMSSPVDTSMAPPVETAIGETNIVNDSNDPSVSVHNATEIAATVSQATPTEDTQFISSALPLPAMVTQSTKDKIWAGDYIDMALIDKKEQESYEQIIKYKAGVPVVQWVPKHKTKSLSIDQWTNNFHIFASIFCEKYPEKFSAVLKYMSVVRKLASKGADWQYYDTAFRRMHYASANDRSWDHIEWELWHEALLRKGSNSSPSVRSAVSHSHPKGFCFKFLDGRPCPGAEGGCNHYHGCTSCQGSHHPNACPTSSQTPRSHVGSFRPHRYQNPYVYNKFQSYSPRPRGFNRYRHPYSRR